MPPQGGAERETVRFGCGRKAVLRYPLNAPEAGLGAPALPARQGQEGDLHARRAEFASPRS